MAAGGGHLEGALHALLSAHVGKIALKMALAGVELGPGVDHHRLEARVAAKERDNVGDGFHAVYVEVVHHCCLAHVLLRHYQTLELVGPGLYGYGKRAAHGLQAAVEAKLANHHEAAEHRAVHLACGGQQADGQWQVVGAALLAEVGGSHIHRNVGHGKPVAVVLQRGHYAVVALAHGIVGQPREVEEHPARHAHLHRNGGGLKPCHGSAICLYKHGMYVFKRNTDCCRKADSKKKT